MGAACPTGGINVGGGVVGGGGENGGGVVGGGDVGAGMAGAGVVNRAGVVGGSQQLSANIRQASSNDR